MAHTSPFQRPRCQNQPLTRPTLGGCWNTFRSKPGPTLKNVSLCLAPGFPDDPTPPYTREWLDGPWEAEDMAPSGSVVVTNGGFYNSFDPTSSVYDVECQYNFGWRQVAARKNWFGKLPYTAHDHNAVDEIDTGGFGTCGKKYAVLEYRDTTKYLYATGEAKYYIDDVETSAVNGWMRQDRYSGNLTGATGSSGDSSYHATLFTKLDLIANQYNKGTLAGFADQTGAGLFNAYIQALGLTNMVGGGTGGSVDSVWNLTWVDTGFTYASLDLDLDANTLLYKEFQLGVGQTKELSLSVGATTITWYEINFGLTETTKTEVIASLQEPYTADNLKSDIQTLLNYYPINDDDVMHWNWSDWGGVCPLMSYDENPDISGPYVPYGGDFVIATYTGDVLGIPNKNIDKFFDFRHEHIVPDGIGGYTHYGYGRWNIDDFQHPATTQWTNQWEAYNNMYPGFFMKMDGTGGALWAAKWAETIFRRHSHKFDRPCGNDDRWTLHPYSASCLVFWDDGTNTANLSANSLIANGDICLLWGTGTTKDGVWSVNRVDATTYTLGTQVATGSQLNKTFDSNGIGFLARLNWMSGVPPFCGRNYITDITNFSCSLEKSGLIDNDQVFAVDYNGNSTLYSVKYLASNVVKLNGWNGTGSFEYLVCPFSIGWEWDDEAPKGDYYVTEYTHNFLDLQEDLRMYNQYLGAETTSASYCPNCLYAKENYRYSQSVWGLDQDVTEVNAEGFCLPYSPCSPAVICVSPSGEVWNINGRTHEVVITEFEFDARAPSLWNVIPTQAMQDMFWTPPPDPDCGAGLWEEDDGTCTKNYAMRPYVEALLTPPFASPLPPPGKFFGVLTQPEVDVTDDPRDEGNVVNSPQLYTGWFLSSYYFDYDKMNQCVIDNGAFADVYRSYGVGGITNITPHEEDI